VLCAEISSATSQKFRETRNRAPVRQGRRGPRYLRPGSSPRGRAQITRANHFNGLAALSRNFFAPSLPAQRPRSEAPRSDLEGHVSGPSPFRAISIACRAISESSPALRLQPASVANEKCELGSIGLSGKRYPLSAGLARYCARYVDFPCPAFRASTGRLRCPSGIPSDLLNRTPRIERKYRFPLNRKFAYTNSPTDAVRAWPGPARFTRAGERFCRATLRWAEPAGLLAVQRQRLRRRGAESRVPAARPVAPLRQTSVRPVRPRAVP
jgi:hypothetical protein